MKNEQNCVQKHFVTVNVYINGVAIPGKLYLS